jgi:7-cyano-7-deazaguanine tRNA-ribosyltransferase
MNNYANENALYKFEMIARDGLARIGRFRTRHGDLATPALLPVINPNNLTVSPAVMEKELAVNGYITNGYIIYNHPELRARAESRGVHSLLGTDLPVMTDSGTFQMYVYGTPGEHTLKEGAKNNKEIPQVDPDEIIKFQAAIKSDIITILDMFTVPAASHQKAEENLAETYKRAVSAVGIKGASALACTVQGGVFPELREQAARQMSELSCEVHPIGGVVPLMENYRYSEVVEAIIASKKGLRPDRPVHLFGAGHPMIFPIAVMLGCDLFDSSSYAKYAHDDRLMYPEGTRHLADIEESPCGCPVCSKYSASALKELPEDERKVQIAMHNLHVSFNELKIVRQAIHEGTLRELVERRARAHPFLLQALKTLGRHIKFLEQYEPLSRRRFFYTGPESSARPELYRYRQRFFERYVPPKAQMLILFEDKTGQKPYSAQFASELEAIRSAVSAHFIAISYFGPVPLELEDIYPLAQSVIPAELERADIERINKMMEHFSHKNQEVMGIIWDGEETLEFLKSMTPEKPGATKANDEGSKDDLRDLDILKVSATADIQFGRGAGKILTGLNGAPPENKSENDRRTISFRKSRKTGRIRNVYLNKVHIISFRARDGYITLKPGGAEMLHGNFAPPRLRVTVKPDSVEFNREGKNVFAKFVVDCDENLRPGDEVLVVDEQDKLVAIGRAVMTRAEMMAFDIGVAVRVREGIDRIN